MKRVLFFIIGALITTVSSAQPISKSISLGADGSRGNFSSVGVTVKADIKKDTGKFTWALSPTYRWSEQSPYGQSAMNLYENEIYLTGNLSRKFGAWKILAFTEDEKSYMRNIQLRGSLGIGAAHDILERGGWDISVSEVILPEYYWSSIDQTKDNFTVRLSTRFKLEYESSLFKLSSTTLYQPAVFSDREVDYLNNLNMRSTNTVTYKIKKGYEIGILYVYSYQGYPYYINKAVSPSQETASLILKMAF
jgi:hypothetical protein